MAICPRSRLLRAGLFLALVAFGFCRGQDTPATPHPPDSIDSLLSESAQRLARGDYEGAIRDASLALLLDPKNPAGYEARGSIYIQEKLWDRAERDYQSAAKLSPDVVYKYKLAEIKFLQSAYEDAKPRFVALEGDPSIGDLAAFKAFLCDLLGLHDAAAQVDLAERDRAPAAPSVYFCHAAWDLYHDKRADASVCLQAADHLFGQSVTERYLSILLDTRRFQLSSASFTDRDGNAYNQASLFLENAGLRVSTAKGWITLPLDHLPDDLSAFPDDVREQIERKRAVMGSSPTPPSRISLTTKSGQSFTQVLWGIAPSGLSVLTPNGWTTLAFTDLPNDISSFPPELQQRIAERSRTIETKSTDAFVLSFTTKQGKDFSNVKAEMGVEGIRLLTPDGWISVPFRDLPENISAFPVAWQPEIQARRAKGSDLTETQVINFTTRGGVRYEEVRATMKKGGIALITSDGLIVVPFSQLPLDLSGFPDKWREAIAQKEAAVLKK